MGLPPNDLDLQLMREIAARQQKKEADWVALERRMIKALEEMHAGKVARREIRPSPPRL